MAGGQAQISTTGLTRLERWLATRELQRLLQTLVCNHLQALSVKNSPRRLSSILSPVGKNTQVNKVRDAQLGIEWMDRYSVNNYAFPENCKSLTSFEAKGRPNDDFIGQLGLTILRCFIFSMRTH